MFTCFYSVQRSANVKTATNKHKSVGPRLREGRSTVGEALLSLRPASSLDYRRECVAEAFALSARKQRVLSRALHVVRSTVQPFIMSDAPAPVAQAKAPAKKAAKPKKPAKPADHPKYNAMIAAAIASLKERGGSSRQAVLKYIMANYKVGDEVAKINARVKTALKAGVKAGTLKQAKGTGASGSFRLGEKKVAAAKPKKAKKPKAAAKKPAAKKPKAAGAKKPKSPKKKPAAKKPKSPAKKAAKPKKVAKSPAKKAAKPKKVAKAPKKAAKKPAKKWMSSGFNRLHHFS